MFLKPVFGPQARRTMLKGFSDILFDLQILLSTEATRGTLTLAINRGVFALTESALPSYGMALVGFSDDCKHPPNFISSLLNLKYQNIDQANCH